jgi:hypothetical protein
VFRGPTILPQNIPEETQRAYERPAAVFKAEHCEIESIINLVLLMPD